MDFLDRLLEHDVWTTERLLELGAALNDAQLDQSFDIGLGSLRATLEHMIRNVEVWTALMAGDSAESIRASRSGDGSIETLLKRHAAAGARLGALAHSVHDRDGWDEVFVDVLDDPVTRKTVGGAIAHVITHNMHHRGQVLFMLRRLKVAGVPEGDVLSWESEKKQQSNKAAER